MPEERYGGIRVDVAIYIAAILDAFALCGLWHGASWTFVLWGMLHGTALALHRAWKLWRPRRRTARSRVTQFSRALAAHFATLTVVVAGWILFRSDSVATAWACTSHVWPPGTCPHSNAVPIHHPGHSGRARSPPADGQGQELGGGGRAEADARADLVVLSFLSLSASALPTARRSSTFNSDSDSAHRVRRLGCRRMSEGA